MPDPFDFRLEAQLAGVPVRLLIDTPQVGRVPRTVLRCIVPSKVGCLARLASVLAGHGAEPPQGLERGKVDPRAGFL